MDRNPIPGEDEPPAEFAAGPAPPAEDPHPPPSLEGRTPQEGLPPAVQAVDLPAPLRDWRVMEIDGEATVVAEAAQEPEPAAPAPGIPDTGDDWIVARLSQRRLAIVPGHQGTVSVELLNNGPRPARFALHVEGWIDERWIHGAPLQTQLAPGQWSTVPLRIALPRAPQVLAGDRRVAVVVQSPDYAGHRCRLGLTLTVEPFGTYVLGLLRPARAVSSWLNRSATFVAPVANRGNAPIHLLLQGSLRAPQPQPAAPYALAADVGADVGAEWTLDFRTPGADGPSFGHIQVQLAPAETLPITVRATPNRQRPFGLRTQWVHLRLTAQAVDRPGAPQVVQGRVACTPFLGPLHLLVAGAVLTVLAAGLVFLGVALSQVLGSRMAAVPAGAPPAALPSVAIIVNMAAPVPTRPAELTPASQGTGTTAGPLRITSVGQAGAFDPAAPVVLPGQVSAPGAPAAAGQPAAVAASPPAQELTYAQMFQEIALRYDLDWRLLAAQAYMESDFDSLAVGPQGALGLMQILPATWNEWAPAAGVADPFDAYQNVTAAAAYLDYLRSELGKMGYPQQEWMLVAYNWGPDKLMDFLRGGGTWDTLDDGVRTYASEALRIAETIPSN